MRVVPPCFNRPPRAAGNWELRGMHAGTGKPLYRWRPSPFEDRCATWDGVGIGPNGQRYPEAHGWDCAGCRWEPSRVRQAREFDEHMLGRRVDNPVDNRAVVHTPPGQWSQADERMRAAWGQDLLDDAARQLRRPSQLVAEMAAASMSSINFRVDPGLPPPDPEWR